MFSRSDAGDTARRAAPPRTRLRRVAQVLACAGALAVLYLPVHVPSATAGVSTDAAPADTAPASRPGPGVTPSTVPPAAAKDAAGGAQKYQIRCWQYGRLVFEEYGVELPADDRYAISLRGMDRTGAAIALADTRNATCLIRALPRAR